MKWFGGCAPGGRTIIPAGARLIWNDPPLWTVGAWPESTVRTAGNEEGRLAVFGWCSADEAALLRALTCPDLSAFGHVWAGSFTVVRARTADTVEVITDGGGACPVYTVPMVDGVVWGSSSRAIASLKGGRVNTDWLASYLFEAQQQAAGQSAWVGVDLVPAGHRLVMKGNQARTSAWWTVGHRPYDEAASLVRDALTEGVRARAAGVATSCDVAGMDSSTLALFASRVGPVTGMTVHPAESPGGSDVANARALAEALPGLRHILFPLDERHLPFGTAEAELPATDEPAPSSVTWSRLSAQLRHLVRLGIDSHLTGDGGDTLFRPPPAHLSDLVRARRWGRLLVDAQSWALARRVSPWHLVRAAIRHDRYALAGGGGSCPPWMTVRVSGELAENGALGAADAALLGEMRYVARSAHTERQLAEALGIELHNPYLDGRVLDAVVSVPPWQRCSTTRYKPLLVDAVGSLLPPKVRDRSTKGVFVGEFHRGLRANLARTLELADGRLAALGLVAPSPLRTAIHTASLGAETAWPALLPTLNAELWLAAVERTPAPVWHDRAEFAA
ncbi:albusnodin/ikarugamycin family macrolactam cyclase [Streptomyces sp. NPDC050560]|uniref:albusnodin/ikarugamycin family macrolactam cyclase n=1 Tax=Streptomyces sp. NPDC050560 TaxID=3365630 RepID=UPI0037AFADCB